MKVYVHYETNTISHTEIVNIDGNATIDTIINEFITKYNNKKGANSKLLNNDGTKLMNAVGELVSNTKNSTIFNFICDKDDLFVVFDDKVSVVATPIPTSVATNSVTINSKQPIVTTKLSQLLQPQEVHSSDTIIRELIKNKSYRKARTLCQEELKKSKNNASLLVLKAEICMISSQYDEAVDYATNAISRCPNNTTYQLVLGKALRAAERLDEADVALENGIKYVMKASSSSSSSSDRNISKIELDLIALRAEVLFDIGKHMEAAALINNYVGMDVADSHVEIMIAYSKFALKYDKYEEAARALLKTVVLDQTNKDAKQLLAKLLSYDKGFNELLHQLPPSDKSAAAYAFLATIAKEYSAMNVCINLLKLASGLKPASSNYILNLAHNYEIVNDYPSALWCIVQFLQHNNSNLRVGTNGYTCLDLYNALPLDLKTMETITRAFSFNASSATTTATTSATTYVNLKLKWMDDDNGYTAVVPIAEDVDDVMEVSDETMTKETLTDDSLDVLAIGFTIVKILYLHGRLSDIPILYSVIEPSRRASAKQPHETLIRNEHAYYQCIAQVLSSRTSLSPALSSATVAFSNPFAALPNAANHPLYVCGDSHVIPIAWSTINCNNQTRLLVPKLVTGIKHWHLRNECSFYPKANFDHAILSIPNGSDVIFIIGEIDCREGILSAVEKDIYPNIQAGMDATIKHFMLVLKKLTSKKKFRKIYIHPVLPILPETRPLVVAYNAAYETAIGKMKLPDVQWLSFVDQLLSEDKQSLLPEYKLDGTHIHAKYIENLLEKSIQAVN